MTKASLLVVLTETTDMIMAGPPYFLHALSPHKPSAREHHLSTFAPLQLQTLTNTDGPRL